MSNGSFVDVVLSRKNIDNFVIRTSIQAAIESCFHNFSGDLLDIGCGRMPYKDLILSNTRVNNYRGVDFQKADYGGDAPDYYWDGSKIPVEDNQFDTVVATEVLEHCAHPEILLSEALRVLKPGGYFFFTVPFMWPIHEVPYDEYRYTPFALDRLITKAGFKDVSIRATGGWHACLAQLLGLWAIRGVGGRKGRALAIFLTPLIGFLKRKDSVPLSFNESQMILGLTGGGFK